MSNPSYNNNNKRRPIKAKPVATSGPQGNSKGFIEYSGEVEELLPGAKFVIVLDNGHKIHAHLSGKMRMFKIRLLPGDRVKVEMSLYDLSKGRITYRY